MARSGPARRKGDPPGQAWGRRAGLALLTAAGLLTSLGACSSDSALPRCNPGPGAAPGLDGYQLGPGDKLQVGVFRHEPLSGEFTLDGTGTLAMPLVGEVSAGGLTTRELEAEIEGELRQGGYLVDPHVGIQVLSHRPFYIVGEVAEPGEYEYVAGMTLVNAVALAGGYTPRADRSGVTISRSHCMREATAATRVLPGDVIRVPVRFF